MQKKYFVFLFCVFLFSSCMYAQEEGYKTIHHAQIFYKIIGTGEPIVVLHGGPGLNHQYFLPHLENLAEEYQLIFFDQRASGKSSLDVNPTTIRTSQMVEDLEALRKSFGLEKMNLMGHSWGGFLAMRYAIQYPQHLKTLLLINSTPASKEFEKISHQRFKERFSQKDSLTRIQILQSDDFKKGAPQAYQKLFQLNFKPSVKDSLALQKIQFGITESFPKSQQMITNLGNDKTLFGYNLHPELKKITCPTLILHGDYDLVALEAQQKMQQAIPLAELVLLSDCGHFPFVEQPEKFKKAIVDFLQKQK